MCVVLRRVSLKIGEAFLDGFNRKPRKPISEKHLEGSMIISGPWGNGCVCV